MPIASWFLVATLVSPGSQLPQDTPSLRLDAAAPAADQRATRPSTPQSGQNQGGTISHTFGMGASFGISNQGAGGAVRYWFGERLGVDMTASYSRYGYSRYSTSKISSVTAAPSMVVMLSKGDSDREINIRPYVGAGLNYMRTSLPTVNPALQGRVGGMFMRGFGGAEFTFRDAPSFAVSAEVAYFRLPSQFSSLSVGGVNYAISFHYYVK